MNATDNDLAVLLDRLDRLTAEELRAELQRTTERDAKLRTLLRAVIARDREREPRPMTAARSD
jgi:hypothetical protein